MSRVTLAPEVQALVAVQVEILRRLAAKNLLTAQEAVDAVFAAPDHVPAEALTPAAIAVFEAIYDRVKP